MDKEKFPTSMEGAHDEEGRIKDPEVAKMMAEAEDPSHKKKFFGLVNPSQEQLQEGENAALETLNFILQKNISNEIADAEIQKLLPRFEKMQEDNWKQSRWYSQRRQPFWDNLSARINNPDYYNRASILDSLIREIESNEEIEKKAE